MRLLLLWAAALQAYDLPALPAYVAVNGDSNFCRSEELRNAFLNRFYNVNVSDGRHAIIVNCREDGDIILEVRRGDGKGIAEFTVERTRSSKWDTLAYLGATHAAKDKEVIAAVTESHFGDNADAFASGASALERNDFQRARDHLHTALESDLEPGPLYFGLYSAAGAQRLPRLTKWYLAAFCKAAGRKPKDLTEEELQPLFSSRAGEPEIAFDADALFAEYEQAARDHRWRRATQLLRGIIEKAPWYEPAYHALAQTYEAARWKRMAKHWRARAAFVKKLNKDSDLGEDIENRVTLGDL